MDCGGWRHTCTEVNTGHVVNLPASMASHHVDSTGENIDAWYKAIMFATV
jgi:hypothetical protein